MKKIMLLTMVIGLLVSGVAFAAPGAPGCLTPRGEWIQFATYESPYLGEKELKAYYDSGALEIFNRPISLHHSGEMATIQVSVCSGGINDVLWIYGDAKGNWSTFQSGRDHGPGGAPLRRIEKGRLIHKLLKFLKHAKKIEFKED